MTDRTWNAQLVTAATPPSDRLRPIRLRCAFMATSSARSAVLAITACGIYRAYLNGHPVGDHVLAPGWQSYRHRHFFQTFDVADLLVDGTNVLGIEVAEGWYRGRLGFGGGVTDNYGTDIGAFAELTVDGDIVVATAPTGWRAAASATLSASLYDGEEYDQRLDDDWTLAGFDAEAWGDVRTIDFDTATLIEQPCPPVRRIEDVAAVAITTSPSGRTLVDFGQNLVGWLRVRLPVSPATVTVRHAEVLEDGELGVRPLRNAAATDVIHTAGTGGAWEPAFTFHGFRYVEIDGWPGQLELADLTAVVCHTDFEPTGTFECSDPLLNRLHENVRWGAKGNFVSVPTDCPQRDERLGWTGDLQVFAPAAAFLFDCHSMLASWLADLAAEQRDNDGVVPMIVPELPKLMGAIPFAGWSDAAVVVPWVLYERYGDPQVLATQYESMVAWVDRVAALSGRSGLWRARFQLGDWLDPKAPPDNPAAGRTDGIMVGGAYQVHMLRLVARAATVLGHHDDAAAFTERADRVRRAFLAEYVTPNGRMMSDSPTAYALAVMFDLLEPEQRERAAKRLIALVEADGFRIGSGFLGTPLMCDALVAAGAPDHAYRLLTQTECPSWLYTVKMGATTMWERWDSMLPDGTINPGEMTSFNHYAFGAVADFLHRRVAGLAPAAPGYEVIDIAPIPGGGLEYARATLRTRRGRVEVGWTRHDTTFTLDVSLPDGCTGVVQLPGDSARVELAAGRHTLTCSVRAAADDPVNSPVDAAPAA